jgi:hypothetical protein
MKRKHLIILGIAALAFLAAGAILTGGESRASGNGLAEAVRQATAKYKDVNVAKEDGYANVVLGCVAGPEEGAMGVHLVGGAPLNDGAFDVARPEALIYEVKSGQWRLVGVEFIELAGTPGGTPPDDLQPPPLALMGQAFHLASTPNRYGIPQFFYELHVWAWRFNPDGTFADWNPKVSCDGYTGETP